MVNLLDIVASCSDSDNDSSDSESSSGNSKSQDALATDQPTRLLSDEELNQLGAKILRAEMMGDEVYFISIFYFD